GGLGFAAIGLLADAEGLRAALLVGFAAVVPAALVARRALAERPTPHSPRLVVIGCGCASSGCSLETAETGAEASEKGDASVERRPSGGRQSTISTLPQG